MADIPPGAPAAPPRISTGKTKPATTQRSSRVAGRYRDRIVIYYHFSSSDIRHIKAANIIAAVFFGVGAWLLTNFVEFSKDITLAGENAPTLLTSVTQVLLVGWILCWMISAVAIFWQAREIHRIKMEHGDPGLWQRFMNWARGNGPR